MKAYKAFDKNLCCRGFQYEVGKEYTVDGKIKICSNGFHACAKISDCFDYYPFRKEPRVAEVELFGETETDGTKTVASKIKIIRELSWLDVLDLCNTGNRNTGYSNTGDMNTGDRNTGDRNTGDWNTGDCNTGNCNTGDWNTGDRNTGYFNTDTPQVRIFNKITNVKNIKFPSWLYVNTIVFVSHDTATEAEKIKYKNEIECCGGFLKAVDYKTAYRIAYEKASRKDIDAVKNLPNFDADIFEEITGLKI